MKQNLLLIISVLIVILFSGCGQSSKQPLPEIEDSWSVLQAQYDKKLMLIRVNLGLQSVAGHRSFQHQAGISVPFNKPMRNGLPEPEEDKQLEAVEDTISSLLEANQESLFAAVVTTNGTREYIFYTGNPRSVHEHFEKLKEKITTHEMKFNIQKDSKWFVYRQFVDQS